MPDRFRPLHDAFEVAQELVRRLSATFLARCQWTTAGLRRDGEFQEDPHWRDLIPLRVFSTVDNGAGLGASHQTGWTGLVGPASWNPGFGKSVSDAKSPAGDENRAR